MNTKKLTFKRNCNPKEALDLGLEGVMKNFHKAIIRTFSYMYRGNDDRGPDLLKEGLVQMNRKLTSENDFLFVSPSIKSLSPIDKIDALVEYVYRLKREAELNGNPIVETVVQLFIDRGEGRIDKI